MKVAALLEDPRAVYLENLDCKTSRAMREILQTRHDLVVPLLEVLVVESEVAFIIARRRVDAQTIRLDDTHAQEIDVVERLGS